jgi:hypothetical protein
MTVASGVEFRIAHGTTMSAIQVTVDGQLEATRTADDLLASF